MSKNIFQARRADIIIAIEVILILKQQNPEGVALLSDRQKLYKARRADTIIARGMEMNNIAPKGWHIYMREARS